MSWLFKSFQSDGPDSSEQDNDDHSPSTTPRGVKDDLSAFGQTLGRQFRGVTNFLAPPPPSSIAAVDPSSSLESQSQSQSQALIGIRNDLVEIDGSLKSRLSLLSSAKAVSEISKLASNLLQFENNEEEEEEEEAFRQDEDNDDVPGVTDDVLDFVSEISTRPEFWTDFPLPLDNNDRFSKSHGNVDMIIKTDRITTVAAASAINSPSCIYSPNNPIKNGKKKRSIIPKIFSSKRDERGGSDEDIFKSDDGGIDLDLEKSFATRRKTFLETHVLRKGFTAERQTSPEIEGLNLSTFEESMAPATELQDIRLFVATWNVGGKTPNNGLNLEDFLQAEDTADIYVLGFQEIVPLSAGNVLVIEDNEPAVKWLALISQALNKPQFESIYSSSDVGPGSKVSNNNITRDSSKCTSSLNFFQRPSLRAIRRSFRADSTLLKSCNCQDSPSRDRWRLRKFSEPSGKLYSAGSHQIGRHSSVEEYLSIAEIPFSPTSPSSPSSPSPTSHSQMSYSLVASKQMVGIFLSVWARKELVPHIGHLRVSSVGRGIMGCFGNKGCISMSMSLHQTSFCFVCSHLASGEKEGDELKRNADVCEILKCTQFPKICKSPNSRAPERINDHDRVIWLGDLNYRVALTYEETRVLLEDNDWDTLLEKDQLNLEREAGRVFHGFDEGRIYFAPTYKYTHNSDSYAGETVKSKKKRRTPAWCDRILWRGNGIEQLSYIRGESRFSDHRPVCAVFTVEVEVENKNNNRFRMGYTCAGQRFDFEDCIPQRHSLYEL